MRLSHLLQKRFHLEPITLSSKPGKRRTLIEKFEDEAKFFSFAFVLLTADDLVVTRKYSQARTNVSFEIGWFYGKIGRSRVVILLQKGTKIHLDWMGSQELSSMK